MFSTMLLFILLVIILPINNYHHSQGYVEYKKQYNLVSQIEGVIEAVYKENNNVIKKGEPIFRYSSEKNEQEIAALEIKESFFVTELNTMTKLWQLGVIQSTELDKKKLEINELNLRKEFLKKNIIYSPISGKIFFKILPKYIKGTYIEKGQVLAIVYTEEEKHIKISFPNAYADRFNIGSNVLVNYKDPRTFKIQKMRGIIYMSFINQVTNNIELYCEITKGKECLRLFNPSTIVNTSIIINNSSIYEDLLGVPINPAIQNVILKNPWYEKIKSHL
jgi:biotin carboxyl carrier protein